MQPELCWVASHAPLSTYHWRIRSCVASVIWRRRGGCHGGQIKWNSDGGARVDLEERRSAEESWSVEYVGDGGMEAGTVGGQRKESGGAQGRTSDVVEGGLRD